MIGVRVECDVRGCGRHFDVDVQSPGVGELVDLSEHSAGALSLEVLFSAPSGWRMRGTGQEFRVLCAPHAETAAAIEGDARSFADRTMIGRPR